MLTILEYPWEEESLKTDSLFRRPLFYEFLRLHYFYQGVDHPESDLLDLRLWYFLLTFQSVHIIILNYDAKEVCIVFLILLDKIIEKLLGIFKSVRLLCFLDFKRAGALLTWIHQNEYILKQILHFCYYYLNLKINVYINLYYHYFSIL